MLPDKRTIQTELGTIRTPILVPSFSSKGFPDVKGILSYSSEIITDEVLVSAYDIYYRYITSRPLTFPTLIFLDSGGYEASLDTDLSDLQKKKYVPKEWKTAFHKEVLDSWKYPAPTVFISYDHPSYPKKLDQQINTALKLFEQYPQAKKELLIKTEGKKNQKYLDINSIIKNVHRFSDFDIIGMTEKELGRSTFDRMSNIAKVRNALNAIGLSIPIHIFGSLDPISTPLYFLSGADIFDGLTWLRFAYHDGCAVYKHNFGALKINIKTPDEVINGQIWNNNYYYLNELQSQMQQFLLDKNFKVFSHNSSFFETAYQRLTESLGGKKDGR